MKYKWNHTNHEMFDAENKIANLTFLQFEYCTI